MRAARRFSARGRALAGLVAALAVASAAGGAQAADMQRKLVGHGTGAVLRALDMVTGRLTDLEMERGETRAWRSLEIRLDDCRYPRDNPASDAFAHLVIRDRREGRILFQGWMIASSPALMAMDHPRYDVWVLRCIGADEAAPAAPASPAPEGGN